MKLKIFLSSLLLLSACSSLPPDVQALKDENSKLKNLLQKCEADSKRCLEMLEQCP